MHLKKNLFPCPVSGEPIDHAVVINHPRIAHFIYDRSSVEAAIANGELDKFGVTKANIVIDHFSQAIIDHLACGQTLLYLGPKLGDSAESFSAEDTQEFSCPILRELPMGRALLCTVDGRTYDSDILIAAINQSHSSPLNRVAVDLETDVVLHPIQQAIMANYHGNKNVPINLERILDYFEQPSPKNPISASESKLLKPITHYLRFTSACQIAIRYGIHFYFTANNTKLISYFLPTMLIDLKLQDLMIREFMFYIHKCHWSDIVFPLLFSPIILTEIFKSEIRKIGSIDRWALIINRKYGFPQDNVSTLLNLSTLFILISTLPRTHFIMRKISELTKKFALRIKQGDLLDNRNIISLKNITAITLWAGSSTLALNTLYNHMTLYPGTPQSPLAHLQTSGFLSALYPLQEICVMMSATDYLTGLLYSDQNQFRYPSLQNCILFFIVILSLFPFLEDYDFKNLISLIIPLAYTGSKMIVHDQTEQKLPTANNPYRLMPRPKERPEYKDNYRPTLL